MKTHGARPHAPGRAPRIPIALFCLITMSGVLQAQAPDTNSGTGTKPQARDDSTLYYEMGSAYMLQKNEVKARQYFERAAAARGNHSDWARLRLIRILAREKRKANESRLPQIRGVLNQIEDPTRLALGWYSAVRSLYDYGEIDGSLELALEMTNRFPPSPDPETTDYVDAAAFLAAEILHERRQFSAALDQLLRLTERYKQGDGQYTDDAYYLMARIFNSPGPYFDPHRAVEALLAFERFGDKPAFRSSPWLEPARAMLRRLSAYR